jgi:hypothetical protein
MFAQQVAPGASVSATFKVTSASAAFNGDLVGHASWTNPTIGRKQVETAVNKIRNASPVKINEIRVNSGAPGNPTDSFIDLQCGSQSVDLQLDIDRASSPQAIFSTVKSQLERSFRPAASTCSASPTRGLAVPRAGDSIIHVRNTDGCRSATRSTSHRSV